MLVFALLLAAPVGSRLVRNPMGAGEKTKRVVMMTMIKRLPGRLYSITTIAKAQVIPPLLQLLKVHVVMRKPTQPTSTFLLAAEQIIS